MDEEQYPSNSHRSKEQPQEDSQLPRQHVEKVASGQVRKKSWLSSIFLPGDIDDIKHYILYDVLGPTIRRTISDMVTSSVNMLLGQSTRSGSGSAPRESYRSYYDRPAQYEQRTRPTSPRNASVENVSFGTRADAENVLWRMQERLRQYQNVSVANFFEFADIRPSYTDWDFGWTDLRNACVEYSSCDRQYYIKFPPIGRL